MNPTPSPLPLLRDFPDFYSPMVVKELRNGLRTRFFTVGLIQFHVLLALLMGSVLLGADQQLIGGIFWGLTLFVVVFVMPLRGFAALRSEVAEGTMDMLTLTNISAFRMVYGKWAALFSQTLLVASSLLPYVVARYQFGGVEIVREAAALGVMVLASAMITAALVAFSTQKSVLLRLLLAAGVFFPAIPLSFGIISVMFGELPLIDMFTTLAPVDQAAFIGGLLFVTVYATYVFLTLGASRFASPAENHSTLKRLVAVGVMTVLGGAGTALALWHPTEMAALWVFVPAMAFTIVLGMDLTTEAMPRVPTVVMKFAHGGPLMRFLGRFLYPGWASGVMLYILLSLAPAAIAAAISHRTGDFSGMKVTVCLLLANIVPAALPILQGKLFMKWWIVQLVLFILGVLLLITADITDTREIAGLGVITPGTALFAAAMNEETMLVAGVVSGLLWLIGAACLAANEMRIYKDLEIDARFSPDLKPQAAPHDVA